MSGDFSCTDYNNITPGKVGDSSIKMVGVLVIPFRG